MKARRRTSFKLILFTGLLASIIAVYLHFGLFPGRLKPYAVQQINEAAQVQVDFDKILILPFQGLSLHHLKVTDKTGAPLFSAGKFAININLIAFIKEKRVVISNLTLEDPIYDYVMEPKKMVLAPPPMTRISGQIPVPVASDEKEVNLEAIAEGPDFFLPENVTLEQIEIKDGLVLIHKKAGDAPTEEIRSINIRMAFQKPPDLVFDGFVKLGHNPYAEIALKGSWNLKTGLYSFYLRTRSAVIPDWLLQYQKNHFLILRHGRLMLETRLQNTNDGKAFFHSEAQLYDSLIQLKSTEYSGRMNIDAKGLFDFDSRSITRYKGVLDLEDVDVKNLSETIPELKNLKGKIHFQPDLLTIDDVQGRYQNLAFKTRGTLQSFKELLLNVTIYTDSKINEVLALLSEEQKRLIGQLSVQGDCQAVTTVRGTLKKPGELQTDFKILVRNGSITSPDKKIQLSKISAQITIDETGLRISQSELISADKKYILNAFIPKSDGSPRALDIHSQDISLQAKYLLDDGTIHVRSGTVSSNGVSANFHGRISRLNDPALDIEGSTEITLNRTKPLLSSYAPAFKDMELDGVLSGPFALKGSWNNPIGWDLSADLGGDPIFIKKNLRLDRCDFQIRMKNGAVHIPYLHAYPYQGTLGTDLWVDLSSPELPFKGKIFINTLDLGALARDLEPKQKDLSGTGTLQASVEGRLKSQESYLGAGSISIRNGKLWQTNLFKAMGKLPFLKVEGLDFVTFHDLNATFNIRDKKLWTQNLSLQSDAVDLALRGSIGFDQSLDLLMDIQYSNNVRLGAMDTGGLAPFIVDQVGDFISQYKLTGTLKEPKYDKMLLPIGRVIGKKISGLLGAA